MEHVMEHWRNKLDRILRPWTIQSSRTGSAFLRLTVAMVLSSMVYGAVMGTFDGIQSGDILGERLRQVLYSAVKMPLLLLVTFFVSLFSAFILSTVLGLRRDFVEAVGSLVSTQTGLAVVLMCLSPLTLLWYAFSDNYEAAVRFNGLMFAISSFAGLWLLQGYYRPLIKRNPKHRWVLWTWWPIYVLVSIQLAWLLRPFVGNPVLPTQFLRPETWGNAYVAVGRLIYKAIVG